MAITVEWDNTEQSVLKLTFVGNWNWDELYRAIDVAESMSAGRPSRVDAIIDLTNAASMPAGSFLNPTFRANAHTLARRANGSHGRIVVVGANSWIVSMYSMFRGLLGSRAGSVDFVNDSAQAYQRLNGTPTVAPFQPTPAEAA